MTRPVHLSHRALTFTQYAHLGTQGVWSPGSVTNRHLAEGSIQSMLASRSGDQPIRLSSGSLLRLWGGMAGRPRPGLYPFVVWFLNHAINRQSSGVVLGWLPEKERNPK